MNEASTWRYALAQQLSSHYSANPEVAAVIIEGSVTRGYADRSSDIDMAVFWTEPPTEKERRDIITHARGRRLQLFPYNEEEACCSEEFEVAGVAIDVRHVGLETTERILTDVLKDYDPTLTKQQHIATLLSALPLSDPSVLTRWQQQAMVYPRELAMAMVRAHLLFRPGWEQEMLAERNDLLALYQSFCTVEKHLLLVLMGLNRIYYPGFRWVDRLIEHMPIAPLNLAPRFKQVFGIVSIDPLAGVYQLHELIEETFGLVETHLSELDTAQARTRFREQRQTWERIPEGLL
jgi:Polymerase beta, Nucleotidyltransferase/Domain of unknown function (DUF4037)